MDIILASQSPRRRELLGQMGISDFIIRPAQGEEKAAPGLSPAQLVEALSLQKGVEVAASAAPGDLVISADTVVAVDGRVLGKPHSREEAAAMLASLSGMKEGKIPLTLILVAVLYLGQEVYSMLFVSDHVANLMHLVGGACGTAFGFWICRNR